MISLFTAIEIPELLRSQLTGLQNFDEADWDANWIAEENFHITIAYVGPVEEPLAEDIDTELRQLRAPGFELQLKGVGVFGGRKPHALYAAVEKTRALQHLYERHVAVLRRLGVEIETRTYTPHVTLARPRLAPVDRVQAWVAANNLYSSGLFPVERTVLFSSHKAGDGRHYEPEREYPLGPILLDQSS
jgi:2'-5' RNA ligase